MRLQIMALAVGCLVAVGVGAKLAAEEPIVFTFHARDLALVKKRIAAADEPTTEALQKLLRKAEQRMKERPYSVVTNGPTPPSGDKHDYMSQAPYWWPDPKEGDGKPYIRRDGKPNPDAEGGDDEVLRKMCDAIWQLSLAWHFTGERRFADQAAKLLRAWYFDPATRMKPRLVFGQYILGHNTGRGAGLIETRVMLKVLDAAGLLAGSESWTAADERELKVWFRDFLDWMRESSRGEDERAADNNHGTWYDAQSAAYAFFIGDERRALHILERARERRFIEGIDPKGRQVHELDRTKAMDYCLLNLEGLMQLALLGERCGLHLWKAHFEDGRGLLRAVEWLAPYAAGTKPWPYEQIAPVKTERIAVSFRRAAEVYGREAYERISSARRERQDDDVTIALALVYPQRAAAVQSQGR
ncbi:MAG: alginate lyase family protein [Planctomycetaceae bacterium]|nr:alginate lyase family protein [Planctomycetaceae bacterium]